MKKDPAHPRIPVGAQVSTSTENGKHGAERPMNNAFTQGEEAKYAQRNARREWKATSRGNGVQRGLFNTAAKGMQGGPHSSRKFRKRKPRELVETAEEASLVEDTAQEEGLTTSPSLQPENTTWNRDNWESTRWDSTWNETWSGWSSSTNATVVLELAKRLEGGGPCQRLGWCHETGRRERKPRQPPPHGHGKNGPGLNGLLVLRPPRAFRPPPQRVSRGLHGPDQRRPRAPARSRPGLAMGRCSRRLFTPTLRCPWIICRDEWVELGNAVSAPCPTQSSHGPATVGQCRPVARQSIYTTSNQWWRR